MKQDPIYTLEFGLRSGHVVRVEVTRYLIDWSPTERCYTSVTFTPVKKFGIDPTQIVYWKDVSGE